MIFGKCECENEYEPSWPRILKFPPWRNCVSRSILIFLLALVCKTVKVQIITYIFTLLTLGQYVNKWISTRIIKDQFNILMMLMLWHLMRWCFWCADAADALMLLMGWCCWCADAAAAALMLLKCWCCLCTVAANVLLLLMAVAVAAAAAPMLLLLRWCY